MQEDVYSYVPRRLFHAQWMLLYILLLTGCGGSDNDTSRVGSSPTLMAAPPQAASGPSRLATQNAASTGQKPPSAVTDDTAVPSLNSPNLSQLSALPHLSALSPREKAGLLLLLPSKSSSERLTLINMYPSLAELPVQQKQVLLDKLEKIVPVTPSQHQ
jgi:hypothetical protein